MTDQRPIDPSTLRDGDYVRAEGDGWAAEGYYYRREIRSKAGWNVVRLCGEPDERVTILRPVLVKGDRVEWTNIVTPKQGTYVGPHEGGRPGEPHLSVVTNAEGRDIIVETDFLTRLPAAPEPAPIEVGDWWADEGGTPHVVEVLHDDSVGMRRWTDAVVNRFVEPSLLRDYWTPLDGPPEPPVGNVYVIAGTVWHHHNVGHLPALIGIEWPRIWDEVAAGNRSALATLRILGSVD